MHTFDQISICGNCGNYLGDEKCRAFQRGIPWEIRTGNFDHRKPYPGDGGIRWTPAKPGDTFRLDVDDGLD
jgi:hypothetical protein